MSVTDLFIKRPVIALSISLIILISGLWAIFNLPLSLYPEVTVPNVVVSTYYSGANPEVVQNYVTAPLQSNLNGMNNVDYMTSSSSQGESSIALHFKLGQNLDQAISTVMRKIQAVSGQLPATVMAPTISSGENYYYFVLQATSSTKPLVWITDYLNRMIVPQFELIDGVSEVLVWGPTSTMDIHLNPQRLIAYHLSVDDVTLALRNNNLPSTPGKTGGLNVSYTINPDTTLHNQTDFDNLIIKSDGAQSISLKDIGSASFDSGEDTIRAYFDAVQGVAIPIAVNPNSNPLKVADHLQKLLPHLRQHMPGKIKLETIFDITKFIRSSLHEVIKAIIESLLVVIGVMLLVLGSPRTVAIPLAAIPLSLIGVCFIMWICHFSFNTLTLLAMVLAIGLVVDDAIVVVENIVRHIESGKSAFQAASIGAREITNPVIAMTLTLAAVYSPMLMASGVTGHLFSEFAMTLAGSVIISGVIALTLSPLLCLKLLNQEILHHPWTQKSERRVSLWRDRYLVFLQGSLKNRRKIFYIWIIILLSCGMLYRCTPHELVPDEDTGILQIAAKAPPSVNLNYLERYRPSIEKLLNASPDLLRYVEVLINNVLFGYVTLKDWSERRASDQIKTTLQEAFNKIAGVSAYVSNISMLPGSNNSNSISIVLAGNVSYSVLYAEVKKLEQFAQATGKFFYLQDDLEYNQPQINLEIDHTAAAAMKLTPHSIATQLTSLLGQGRVQQFALNGRNYDVKISIPAEYRRNPEDIGNIQVSNLDGQLIPLHSVISLRSSVVPQVLNQFQKMNSVTITAVPSPRASYSDALSTLQQLVDAHLDKALLLDYSGMTRQFIQEGQRTLWVFAMAILVIFLVLSIQFNRFLDAFIILLGSVPLALFGALLPLWLGMGTINIYTQIGFLTLIGLVSKHGILLTEFANHAQIQDRLPPLQAILQSARLRFRPIVMTTAAMAVGALPLVFATGAGAESRYALGIVIVFGVSFGTFCTLVVVPTLYLWFGRNHLKETES